ncbi:MAG: hypothetical protein WC570_04430, partial [Patescibacteria group bacterium]
GLTAGLDKEIDITFANEFDLSAVTIGDVDLSLGGVDVDLVSGVPAAGEAKFTKNGQNINFVLNSAWSLPGDGEIDIKIGSNAVGGVNKIGNPSAVGAYLINLSTSQSSVVLDEGTIGISINHTVLVTLSIDEYLSFSLVGVGSGQNVNGVTTNLVTNATNIDFGSNLGAFDLIAAQDLMVSTNATSGFTVTVKVTHDLNTGLGDQINNFPNANAAPAIWSSPPGSGVDSYWGYTTDDNTLGSGMVNRFTMGGGDKWAGFTTSEEEVFYHDGPIDGTGTGQGITRVGYQAEANNWQASGDYSTEVVFLCTGVF